MPVYSEIHQDIIEASRKGDRKAQFRIYQLYSKAMFNICYRMMNNREEAEDMLQESFCEAFDKLNTFRYESSFGAWLRRIVVNKCINELKRKKTLLVLHEDLGHFEIPVEDSPRKDEDFKLEVEKVRKAVECLADGYRVIFSLYLFEGYDHEEIAQIMGITESTSKTQYLRAKQKVRERLLEENKCKL